MISSGLEPETFGTGIRRATIAPRDLKFIEILFVDVINFYINKIHKNKLLT